MDKSKVLKHQTTVIDKTTKHIQSQGVSNMGRLMQDIKQDLEEYEKMDVNVAITGQSGAGKSSLINCLRNLKPGEKGAAEVGCTETTMDMMPYIHPEMPKVVLWDLPGVNTPNFPKASYEERVGLPMFDALIICTSTRFLENDLWLAQRAEARKVPYYCVRTKIDQDVQNDIDDHGGNHNEARLLAKMKSEIQQELMKANIPKDNVHLISTKIRYQTKWGFDSFQRELIVNAPTKNRTALVMALIATSYECIDSKGKAFAQRIDNISRQAVQSRGNELSIVQQEINRYREGFGINDTHLKKWGVKIENMKSDLQNIKQELQSVDSIVAECQNALTQASKAVVRSVPTVHPAIAVIPIFGLIAVLTGTSIDKKKRQAAAEQRKQNIKEAEASLEAAKRTKETTDATAERKRQELVKERSQDVLRESLKHYATLAKGILDERQNVLKKDLK